MTWITSTASTGRRGLVTVGLLTAAATVGALGLASPAAAYPAVPAPENSTVGTGPANTNFPAAFAQSFVTPDAAPIGANDWDCKPSAEHPRPVVLVHGTWENAYDNWSGVAPALKAEGYCVFALNYGKSDLVNKGGAGEVLPNTNGTKAIELSAKELATYVDAVLDRTGAEQVDLVGHSQGGIAARQYLKFEGGTDASDPSKNKVKNVVTLGATNHGTSLLGIGTLDRQIRDLGLNLDPALDYVVGESGIQQVYDSPFLNALNEGGDTQPGVNYTVIGTRYDEVTNPYEWTFLEAGPDATVRNVTLQDGCAADLSDHLSMTYSPRAIDWIKHGLDPEGFAADQVVCTGNSPVFGNSEGGAAAGPATESAQAGSSTGS
ncbi:alpha/beta fold hydrolase [Rhodococcus sp. HNM0569]|uniref:lipase family alpha/beta hydrolase n=1 Tax=Rhodococcus sp. HNM0569 TaxID=2716340 RepID=UPI00146A8C86|nr:alpha/beta fold hydrolase [Rhodococcus sp. HNM0569]NLU84326.1 alpha/beta fold hydrolase [Rhodococcus sp. HNM0569]